MMEPRVTAHSDSPDLTDSSIALIIGLSWSKRITLGATMFLACLGSAELAVRVDDLVRFDVPLSATPSLSEDLVLRDSLGPRGRPNGRYFSWKLNSAGFRSDESVVTPVPGCLRVMTMGASETFGVEGQELGKEYPAQLNDSLSVSRCSQVMNAGIAGIALPGMSRLWNLWAWRFEPDIVVVLANPMFYLGERAPAPPAPIPAAVSREQRSFSPRLLAKARSAIQFPAIIQRRRAAGDLAALTAGHPEAWFFRSLPTDRLDAYRRDLDSLVTAIQAQGARPILVTYPMRFGSALDAREVELLDSWRRFSPRATTEVMLEFQRAASAAVLDLGRTRGVPVVDLQSNVTGHPIYFIDAVHYTDLGAAVVAQSIASVALQLPVAKQR